MILFLPDLAPQLIGFYVFHAKGYDLFIHEFLAALTGFEQEAHNRVAICASDSFCRANRVAFQEQSQSEHRFLRRDVHGIENALVGFRVRLPAARATEAAQTVAVFSESLTVHLARLTDHGGCGLRIAHHAYIIQQALAVCQRRK